MRKTLLGTSAIAGAALFSAGAFAQTGVTTAPGAVGLAGTANVGTQGVTAPSPAIAAANALSVRIGGFFDFSMAGIQDDLDRAATRNSLTTPAGTDRRARSRYDFRNDLEVNIFVDGRAANGMTYGAVIEFQMDNANAGGGSGTTVDLDEAYIYLTFPNFGTLRMGQEDNAPSLLQVRAPTAGLIASDGDWYDFINTTSQTVYSNYMLSGINDGNDSTRVIYLSPQFAGFDFGLAFAPNSGEGERDQLGNGTSLQRDRTALENEYSGALRYRGTFGPVGLNLGAGAMTASAPLLQASGSPIANRPQTVTAYTVGATVSAYGFAFGGEYTWGAYNGASVGRAALNPGLDDSQHWLVGISYTMGPLLIGGNFGQGKQSNGSCRVAAGSNCVGPAGSIRDLDDRTHTAWGIGAVYTLAPGLATYVIYQNINDENVPISAPSDARYGGNGTQLAAFNGGNTRTINVLMGGVRLAF